jgi:hypothetical protein
LAPITQEKRKRRTNKYVNFQAESVALRRMLLLVAAMKDGVPVFYRFAVPGEL